MDEENNVEKKLKDSNSLKGKYIKKIEWKKDEETEFMDTLGIILREIKSIFI